MSTRLARSPDALFRVTGSLKNPPHTCLLAQLLVVAGHFVLARKMTQGDRVTLFHDGPSSQASTAGNSHVHANRAARNQMCWPVRIPPHPCVKGNSTASRREKSSQDQDCGFNSAFVCFPCRVPRCAISCAKKKRSTFLEITFVFKLTLAKTISGTKSSSKVAGVREGLSGLTTLRKS